MTDTGTARSTMQMVRLLLGGSANVIFITVFSLLGALAPSYDFMRNTISSLEWSPLGYAQQINFVVFGLLLATFAYALRVELVGGRGAVAIPLFQLAGAGAVIGDGLFTRDPGHMTCDLVAFNSTLIVLFLFAWRFWGDPRWRGWTLYTVATAVGMMSCLTAFGIANHSGGLAGLFERLAVVIKAAWSVAFVSRLLFGNSLRPGANSALLRSA